MPDCDATRWNVLLIEDDEDHHQILARVLDFHGVNVISAYSGQEGLTLLSSRHNLTLALIDIQMPGISGWEVLKMIRSNPLEAIRRMPIVAITAQALTGDRERVLDAGFDGYLSKPIDPLALIENICQALKIR